MTRLLKCSSFYPEYLRRFYAEHPGLEREPYGIQYRTLMDDCFGWADFWKQHLERDGRFSVMEVVTNCAPLQKAWARENGVPFDQDNWLEQIVEAQLRAHQPDVWFVHGYEIRPQTRARLRKDIDSLRWVIGWDGLMRNDPGFFAGTDHVLACHPESVRCYRSAGLASHLFRLGFETSICSRVDSRATKDTATFVGSVALHSTGHNERLALLDRVAASGMATLWLAGGVGLQAFARAFAGQVLRGNLSYVARMLPSLGPAWRLGKITRGSVFGLSMYQVLARSRISLNAHIDAAGFLAGNMRLFEATGVGSCLLTDWKENLAELFVPDEEVVTYRNAGECCEKIRYLLDNDAVSRRIAEAGRARTHRDHSLGRSVGEFVADFHAACGAD